MPNENQSSFRVEVPTYLMAPMGIVLSDLIDSCLFTTSERMMYTDLVVFQSISRLSKHPREEGSPEQEF